jgi:hypothetical protein
MDAGRMPTDSTGGRIRFVFDTTANVVSGNSYWGVFHVDYPQAFVGNENHLSLGGATSDTYAGGTAKQFSANTNTWQSANSSSPTVSDFYIRTFVESFNTDLLMPTGYDQRCLLSYMITSGGTDPIVAEYHQRGTKIETNFHFSWDINYNGAFGGGSATDTQTGLIEVLDMRHYVPPVPCLVTFAVTNYTGDNRFTCVGGLASTDMGGLGATPVVIESSGQICSNIPASAQLLFGPIIVEHQSVLLRTHSTTTTLWTAEVEY